MIAQRVRNLLDSLDSLETGCTPDEVYNDAQMIRAESADPDPQQPITVGINLDGDTYEQLMRAQH